MVSGSRLGRSFGRGIMGRLGANQNREKLAPAGYTPYWDDSVAPRIVVFLGLILIAVLLFVRKTR
jgi:hypothetical protein